MTHDKFFFRNGCKVSVTSNMEPDLTALMSEVHFCQVCSDREVYTSQREPPRTLFKVCSLPV